MAGRSARGSGRRRAGVAVAFVTVGLCLTVLAFVALRYRQQIRDAGWVSGAAATVAPSVAPSVTPSASPTPSARPSPAPVTTASLASYLASAGPHAGVAAYDRITGAQLLYQANNHFSTASVVKVDILASLLWKKHADGDDLTDTQRAEATKMITQSDNNAASALWADLHNGADLLLANKAFGLTSTTLDSQGRWGQTRTTPADQLRLLKDLTDEDGPLTEEARDYVLDLMGKVESDQRWGVPKAADPDATEVDVKNGWLATATDSNLWIVNSIGRIVEPGHDYLIVVLTYHHATESQGITMVEKSAKLAAAGLR